MLTKIRSAPWLATDDHGITSDLAGPGSIASVSKTCGISAIEDHGIVRNVTRVTFAPVGAICNAGVESHGIVRDGSAVVAYTKIAHQFFSSLCTF